MVIKPIALPSGKRCTHPLYDTLDNTLPPMGTAKGISLLFGLFIDLPIVGLSVCTLQANKVRPPIDVPSYLHINRSLNKFLPIDLPLNSLIKGFNGLVAIVWFP